MKKIVTIILAVSFTLSTQIKASEKKLSCDETVADAENLNAFKLWDGAETCFHDENKPEQAMFLLIAGQIRAEVDLAGFIPVNLKEKKVDELRWLSFYFFGGLGLDETYRNKASRNTLFHTLQAWQPDLNNTYSPGWQYKREIKPENYKRVINCAKKQKIARLKWHAKILQNDEYYSLHKTYRKLLKENKGIVEKGSKAAKYRKLASLKKNEILKTYPAPEVNFSRCSSGKP